MTLTQPLPGRIPPSSFRVPDPEGAPDRAGIRRHGALDWFGKPGSGFYAPEPGIIVESVPDRGCRDSRCQIYGGTIKLQTPSGRVWVFRHVDPGREPLRVGAQVKAGQILGAIARWPAAPNSSHAHIELWRSIKGGYRFENLSDPAVFLAAGRATSPDTEGVTVGDVLRGGFGPGVTGAVKGVTGAVSDVVETASDIGSAIAWPFKNWDRILEVLGGFVLLIVGLYLLGRKLALPTPSLPLPGRVDESLQRMAMIEQRTYEATLARAAGRERALRELRGENEPIRRRLDQEARRQKTIAEAGEVPF